MKKKLRILILDDVPADAELVKRELQINALDFISVYADSKEAFLKQLEEFSPDIILSDYSMPQFTGMDALALVKDRIPAIPLIIVTGSMNEETAAECMKNGAADYVLKEKMARLGPAVNNALERARSESEKRLAIEALRESEERLAGIIQAIPDFMSIIDENYNILWTNEDNLNSEISNFVGRKCYEAYHHFDQPCDKCLIKKVFADGDVHQHEAESLTADGETIYQHSIASVASRYPDGKPKTVIQLSRDITEQKMLEEQFHQAQKMESIGRLAGGVAHDFNNLLTVIGGNATLAEMSIRDDDPLHKELEQIQKATTRAAKLTGQLLAFSRKQTIQPKILDLNEIVHDMEKMLHRLIREDIKIQFTLGRDTGVIKADQGQIEQIIANLTVNARDAMPEGGAIKISTRSVVIEADNKDFDFKLVPGAYAELYVTDSGCGMSEEIKSKIFEPFFTTKELGKGTGLGLSTVFGIVKQSKGYVLVDSKVGEGTTFRILFPQTEDEFEKELVIAADKVNLRGKERILIVEDEETVRIIAERSLQKFGYQTVSAKDGFEALRLFEYDSAAIDLVISDMVMPGIRGNKLVEMIKERFKPDLKALFISGYIPEDEDSGLVLEAKIPFLQKPFEPLDLAKMVRKVLDS